MLNQIYKVQLAKMKQDPSVLMLILIQPAVMSLLFGFFYSGVGQSKLMILLFMGVALMSMWQTMLFSGGIIVRHDFFRERTIPYHLVSSGNLYLTWSFRLLICLLISTVSFLISFLIGALIFHVVPNGHDLGLLLIGALLSVFTMLSIGLPLMFLLFLNPNGGKIIQTLSYPIYLLSGMIVSVDHFPTILRIISYLFPITWSTHFLQGILTHHAANWSELLVILVLSGLYMVMSWIMFRYIVKKIRESGEITL